MFHMEFMHDDSADITALIRPGRTNKHALNISKMSECHVQTTTTKPHKIL